VGHTSETRKVAEKLLPCLPQDWMFATPPSSSLPEFPHVPLGVGGWTFGWATKSEGVEFRRFAEMICNLCGPDPPTSQTDGQTDGRHAIAIPRFAIARRAVKTAK